ncbi:tripartite tricarboxylate transporter substrate binding protein [Diaphorobacter sp.]|uniref:Bug family tripartite tricarboxylate transporter substrate binding protein n=1 Tax=Diaphorobacter sp. TaxID=1934310 RepID=UPI0028AC6B11|nr:tripartite tricarboxylate transporter substrate binding protein [Diaphorobacter sp.]
MQRRIFSAALMACAASAFAQAPASHAGHDTFPSKPIRVIIPSTPGGGTDYIGRSLSNHIHEITGWTLVPDNRPGAGTALGLGELARQAPTGYDIVVGQSDNVSLIPLLMKTSYDPQKDLQPVSLVATTPMVILVAANSPYKTLNDMIADARRKPGQINYGTSGTGGSVHIAIEMLQAEAKFTMQHVPYKGSTPALADLVGGHLSVAGASISSAVSLIQANKVRALAVTSPGRNPALPDVPSVSESGYKNYAFVTYYGVLAPAGTPKDVVGKLNDAVVKVMARPDVKDAFAKQGLEASTGTPEAFRELIDKDIAKAKAIITSANIKVN